MRHSFKQLRIWKALKRRPGLSRGELMERLKLGGNSVSNALYRMQCDGTVEMRGRYRGAKWYATGKAPEDGRGLEDGSQMAIEPHQRYWKECLVLANKAKGVTLKPVPVYRPKPAIALEQCWGYMPLSGTFEQSTNALSNDTKPAHPRAQPLVTLDEREEAA